MERRFCLFIFPGFQVDIPGKQMGKDDFWILFDHVGEKIERSCGIAPSSSDACIIESFDQIDLVLGVSEISRRVRGWELPSPM